MITPILIHIFSYSISLDISKKIRKVIIKGYVFLVGATILVLGVTLDGIYEHFLKAFSSTEEPIKFQQLNLLYNSFLESPILGNGIGDVLYEPYRDRYGSSFELSYFFELNSTGVIGILTYILIFYFIFLLCFRWIKVNNDTILFGLMVGFITYLIGNFTNPFLCSYDYLWPLYIVIAYINISFLMKTDTHEY
jgi:O-antigen ligase